ncbi:MAG: hypothetical protein J6R35_02190, partial [Clostridia bacterium]|nr:hypothetical protein [Clostridia bacterium]
KDGYKKELAVSAETLTIALKQTADGKIPTKIRFGAAAYIHYQDNWSSSGEKVCKVPIPEITQPFQTDTYANPSIEVRLSDDTTAAFKADGMSETDITTGIIEVAGTHKEDLYDSGSITINKKYKAGYNNVYNLAGTNVGSIVAKVIPNYYFAGWTITSGNISDVINASARNYRNRQLSFNGGAYLKGDVVVYAHYKPIELDEGSRDKYTYLQDSSGETYTPKRQGPAIKGNFVDATGNGAFDKISGTYDKGNDVVIPGGSNFYTGTTAAGVKYASAQKPYDSNDRTAPYEYIVCVYQYGDTGNLNNGLLGYIRVTFAIDPIAINNADILKYYADGAGIDDWVYSPGIPSRPYTGTAYQPIPKYVKIKADTKEGGQVGINYAEYKLEYGKDYSVAGYSNNVNVGKATLNIKGDVSSTSWANVKTQYRLTLCLYRLMGYKLINPWRRKSNKYTDYLILAKNNVLNRC